ncbi:MAG: cyclic-di-AMP receptor, partial [Chloroflexi bacterium]|nr:cyclic-di-AMP receptor [Chloroflexota bacterium]
MNLILAIVNEHDVAGVVNALTASGYGVTRLNTASGLLKMSNVTLLVGVEDDQAD